MAVSIVALVVTAEAAEPITGRASVTDGDTVVIRDTRIRLHGIDAPESAQLCQDADGKDYRCGQRAALALSDRIGASPITCEPRDTDRYGRTVAICRKGTEDLNAWMVEQGHAIAFRRYAKDYVGKEDGAREAKRGIWGGTFQDPGTWRREQRSPVREAPARADAPSKAAAPGECAIKGNINRKGERIFHMPGTRDYDRTAINTAEGERWFCSEAEAEGAGWRRPRT
ncbi:thermonuclease family protein [Methylobacterium sp. D53M]